VLSDVRRHNSKARLSQRLTHCRRQQRNIRQPAAQLWKAVSNFRRATQKENGLFSGWLYHGLCRSTCASALVGCTIGFSCFAVPCALAPFLFGLFPVSAEVLISLQNHASDQCVKEMNEGAEER
jgi:hypothetical protein